MMIKSGKNSLNRFAFFMKLSFPVYINLNLNPFCRNTKTLKIKNVNKKNKKA